jgi:hypothetical protein
MPSLSRIFIILAAIVFASLVWHAFELEHGHAAALGGASEAVFHFVLSAEMVLLAAVFGAVGLERLAHGDSRPAVPILRQWDPLALFLSAGILHPKLYA